MNDIPITPSDPPLLGWTCKEVIGCPVVLYDVAKNAKKEIDLSFMDENKIGELKVGMELVILALFGLTGPVRVFQVDEKRGGAISTNNYYPLDYDDERKCWVNSCCVSLKAMQKFTMR